MTTSPAQPQISGGNALVLAGGGVAGIGWELGVLQGIADVDSALAEQIIGFDLVVGTSAGSTVAAQITSGVGLDELYAAQLRPPTTELEVDIDMQTFIADFSAAMQGATEPVDAARRIGALALAASTVDPALRLAAIDARLPVKDWPSRRVLLTAVDAETGEFTVFTRESEVALRDAVAASSAVPGVWPPVAIGRRRYIDGGVRSMANADLAAGADRVLIILPLLGGAPEPWGSLEAEISALGSASVYVIRADQVSAEAFGTNPLSPTTRAPSARAGRVVGAAHAAGVAALWK